MFSDPTIRTRTREASSWFEKTANNLHFQSMFALAFAADMNAQQPYPGAPSDNPGSRYPSGQYAQPAPQNWATRSRNISRSLRRISNRSTRRSNLTLSSLTLTSSRTARRRRLIKSRTKARHRRLAPRISNSYSRRSRFIQTRCWRIAPVIDPSPRQSLQLLE